MYRLKSILSTILIDRTNISYTQKKDKSKDVTTIKCHWGF